MHMKKGDKTKCKELKAYIRYLEKELKYMTHLKEYYASKYFATMYC